MKRAKPLISVITVVLNDREGLERTIQSVIAQSSSNFEHIVIDGGSTDGTLDVIERHQDNIDFWTSDKDSGIYEAMNRGVLNSTGEYLNFLNAGDVLYEDEALEKVSIVLIEKKPELLGCQSSIVYDAYSVTTSGRKRIKVGRMPPHQATFVKKEVFENLGGFSLEYKSSSDFDFYCKYIKSGGKVEFNDIIVGSFYSGGTSSYKDLSYPEGYRIMKEHFGLITGFRFYLSKILLEQGMKKLLIKLKLKSLLNKLKEINNRRRVR